MSSDKLIEYEQEHFEELWKKFLRNHNLDDEWTIYVYEQYQDFTAGFTDYLYEQYKDVKFEEEY